MSATSDGFVAILRDDNDRSVASSWTAFWRPTLRWFYLALILAGIALALAIGATNDPPVPEFLATSL